AITSPAVMAGSELIGLPPKLLVVAIIARAPRPRRCPIWLVLKRCSRSLRKILEGPGSHERQVLSFGRCFFAANTAAAYIEMALCSGTFLSGNSALPK